jgi:hypothetical protein
LACGLLNDQDILERLANVIGSALEILPALIHARKFAELVRGTSVRLTTGQEIQIKIQWTRRSYRPIGYRFAKHSFVACAHADTAVGYGFGESEYELLAVEKSIAEAVERSVFRYLKSQGMGTKNSNGWSAHLNIEKARSSAIEELCERDAVLTHWLTETPMEEIDPSTFPKWLRIWTQNELQHAKRFNNLRVLLGSLGHLPSVTTVLQESSGHAVVSHATAKNLETAIYKSLAETCRIAQLATENENLDSSKGLISQSNDGDISPLDHAMVYAHHLPFPKWIFGNKVDFAGTAKAWKMRFDLFSEGNLDIDFQLVMITPLAIGFTESKSIQNLFTGSTKGAFDNGLINEDRILKRLNGKNLNSLPHCVA